MLQVEDRIRDYASNERWTVGSENDLCDFFYLCVVGQPDSKRAGYDFARKFTNVHLAVRPRKDSVASVGSVYGVAFKIKDAQAIPIKPRPDGFQNLPETAHTLQKLPVRISRA
jgi:hypothetical protein